MLIVVFLVTDYLLYKPVVVFGALCYSIYYVIYIWGHSLPAQQVFSLLSVYVWDLQ